MPSLQMAKYYRTICFLYYTSLLFLKKPLLKQIKLKESVVKLSSNFLIIKNPGTPILQGFPGNKKERETGIEPATPSLARRCSTTEPLAHIYKHCGTIAYTTDLVSIATYHNVKAGDGNRTHVSSLEGWCSTIELHPHAVPRTGIEPVTRGFSVLCSTD